MIEIPSKIEGMQYDLYKLEQLLKPLGYAIGGNWDYDHGSFDYKIADQGEYQFLRVPFQAIDGQLDSRGCTVELSRPYLLGHQYERGLDDQASTGNFSASFNQFAEPVNKDADVPERFVELGKAMIFELESILI